MSNGRDRRYYLTNLSIFLFPSYCLLGLLDTVLLSWTSRINRSTQPCVRYPLISFTRTRIHDQPARSRSRTAPYRWLPTLEHAQHFSLWVSPWTSASDCLACQALYQYCHHRRSVNSASTKRRTETYEDASRQLTTHLLACATVRHKCRTGQPVHSKPPAQIDHPLWLWSWKSSSLRLELRHLSPAPSLPPSTSTFDFSRLHHLRSRQYLNLRSHSTFILLYRT
jgi:hypothetical protein